ncbi:hypothetical protein NQ314_004957 [Rhamnusium bicolor]|uniref:DUF7869 domain-containing protein n=1 Tax=Rhamnusium bicolor TaxID=1586634 RepID=A0AAV8ZIK5_9CUCU|nr:hypothetical protein NQ314_004957 [Rhamnusium bicolor]
MGLIQVTDVKRRRHGLYKGARYSHRQTTAHYRNLDGEGNIVIVCKSTFMNTFNLTKKHLDTIIKGKSAEVIYKDMRTRTTSSKFTKNDRRFVKEHINSIPREESHSRAKSAKKYMSPHLNTNRLHKAFLLKYPESLVTYNFYRRVLKEDFPNVSFRAPRSDICRKCDSLNYEIKPQGERSRTATLELELHHRKAEAATLLMKTDIASSQMPDSTVSVLSMDLEQVMFVQTLTHSEMFYMRQLSCHNLSINFGDNKRFYMCFWHEGLAGRGGNEVASCLLRVLNMGISHKRNIVVWSDNCLVQNKNKMIVFIYMFLVSSGHFDTIEHGYLVNGHSLLQCNRGFALIKKRKRKCASMVPEGLHHVILSSTHTGRFEIVDMCQKMFFDIQAAADKVLNIK